MRWPKFVRAVALAGAVVAGGCGSPAPSLAIPSSGACAGIPLIDRNNPPDSLPLTRDPELEHKLPAEVDGNPVVDVSSGRYVETLCMLGGEASLAAANRNVPAGVDINDINVVSGKATVDGAAASVTAYRVPGGSGADLISIAGVPTADLAPVMLGGKAVETWTNAADGSASYLYASGDTVYDLADVTASQAGKILAALP